MVDFPKTIKLQNIEVIRDQRKILSIPNASLSTEKITAVIGPNGAGKTTLLKLLHGLIEPNKGTYNPGASLLQSALVLHHTPLIRASVKTNLSIVKDSPNIKISDKDINEALDSVGLSHLSAQSAVKLSAGERQRLSLARAKLQKPQLILLDEPTANLDPSATEQVEKIIIELSKSGCGVIFTSHHLAQVQRLAKEIVFLADGQCEEIASTEDFFSNPTSNSAQLFLERELGWK